MAIAEKQKIPLFMTDNHFYDRYFQMVIKMVYECRFCTELMSNTFSPKMKPNLEANRQQGRIF